nr:zinc finger BED domain-containing protein RICESLEEPER 2-like [Ipomoea batatas]
MTSRSVNYSGSAPGINAEYDFDSEIPSLEQPEPKSPSIEEVEQPNSEEPKPKRPKSTTSDVWKSFTKIGVVDGKEKAKCNGCGKEYIVGGIRYGTSSLLCHIPKCVALPKYHNVGTMMLDAQGKLRSRQLDHKCLREVMAMVAIKHNLPYSFVEYRRVREMLSICNPDVKEYTRNTAMNDEYTDFSSENASVIKKSDLDTYLEEGKLDTKSNMHLGVLQYWKEHQARFPCLSKMACDILSIPITTVASESSFSIGSRVLTKYRCSLLSENVQALICTRNWLQRYNCEDVDDEGINTNELIEKASNVIGG